MAQFFVNLSPAMSRSVKIFGDKLAAARKKAYLTQAALGQKLGGMTDENIGRIERSSGDEGIMSKHIPSLAAALGMTIPEVERTLIVPESIKKRAAKKHGPRNDRRIPPPK